MNPVLIFLSIYFFSSSCLAQQKSISPAYRGIIKYTSGGFGSFSYPVQGDSVLVFLEANDKIRVKIFSADGAGIKRDIEWQPEGMKLIKKEMYMNIISPGEQKPTGDYNLKYIGGNPPYNLQLVHFSDGSMAELTLQSEPFIYSIFIADIKRVK